MLSNGLPVPTAPPFNCPCRLITPFALVLSFVDARIVKLLSEPVTVATKAGLNTAESAVLSPKVTEPFRLVFVTFRKLALLKSPVRDSVPVALILAAVIFPENNPLPCTESA